MKIQAQYYKQLEEDFIFELGYQEWCRDNLGEVTNEGINEMEQDSNKPYYHETLIVSTKALNNTKYKAKDIT
jgi:hypothetical protein